MQCPHCKRESSPASHICPYCGAYMTPAQETPAQGASLPVYDERDYAYAPPQAKTARTAERTRHEGKRAPQRARRGKKAKQPAYQRRMINWAKVAMALVVVAFVALAGLFVYLKVTPNGQLILARLGREASSDAYWTLGTEYLDQGYIARSIQTYNKALSLQPERPDLVDKLILLAEAYEAASQPKEAEAIYFRIFEEIKPQDPIGYRNAIRLMLSQEGREMEATELMRLAYEKTKDEIFFNQRSTFVPQPPTASLSAGRYEFSRTVEFVSPQGYDIYYTQSPVGDLPETGQLYTGPIKMEEGNHLFRAVCVASELVSDEMSIKYVITLPTPLAPRCNIAPGEYARTQKIILRNMDEDKKVTLYYTIDGSKPTVDSPRFDGQPIVLGGGRVTIRAIAVNRYGKISNEMNVQVKIKIPFKNFFRLEDDQFAAFGVLKTSFKDFTAKVGEAAASEEIVDEDANGKATKLTYPWGEARFRVGEDGNLLYYLRTSDPAMSGPRRTAIGMDMEEVIAKFRDMNQKANDRGDRGLYYDTIEGYANYTVAADQAGTGVLTYVSTISVGKTAGTAYLIYDIQDGKVRQITLRHVNRRVSNVVTPLPSPSAAIH